MTILDPRHFLRVEEKFLPAFALFDDALDTPGLLSVYVALWYFACKRSRPTQVELARCSKCGLRALQSNLSTLVKRGYVAIRKEGGRNLYDLVLSPQVVSELLYQGVEYQNIENRPFYSPVSDAQNLRIEHAKSAPSLKSLKNLKRENTPLSPLPNGSAPELAGLSRDGSLRPAFSAHGSGEFHHSDQSLSPSCRQKLSPLGADWSESSFLTLWAAWPVHQGEAPARRVFFSLAQKGVLPSVPALLAVIKSLKASDYRWRDAGRYVPQLSHWLRDERWRDEPVSGKPASGEPVASPSPATVAVSGAISGAVKDETPFYSMKEKENLTLSPKTLALLASSPWMSKKALANLQAHCTETLSHEQESQRYGEGRISGLPARDSGDVGERLLHQHGVCGFENDSQNHHWLQPVLAVFEGQRQACVSLSASPSVFSNVAAFAPQEIRVGAYGKT